MKETNLIQSMTNIKKIRLFNNSLLYGNPKVYLDFSRIDFFCFNDTLFLFIPENLCIIKTEYKNKTDLLEDIVNGITPKDSLYSQIMIGLVPAIGSNTINVTQKSITRKKGISIVVTTKCNMNCEYCIYKNNSKYSNSDKNFSEKIFNSICECIDYWENEKDVTFIFSGGEPFLDFCMMKQLTIKICEICAEKKIKANFGVTTNGTILNQEIIDFLIKYNFLVSISLDGTEDHYIRINQFKFFDLITKNIKKLKQNHINYSIKSTVSYNINNEEMHLMLDYICSLSPYKLTITPDIFREVPSSFLDVCNNYSPKNDTIYKPIIKDMIDNIYNFRYVDHVCSSSDSFVGINEKGQFLPCLFFNGIEEKYFKTYEELRTFGNLTTTNLNVTNYYLQKCSKCSIRLLCGGLCSYVKYQLSKYKIDKNAVDSFCEYKYSSFVSALKYICETGN